MSTIASGFSKSMELAHLSLEVSDLETSQTIMLNVYREQMRYFEVCSNVRNAFRCNFNSKIPFTFTGWHCGS